MNVYYKSKFTGIEIDQRLAQGTYDDAVKAGFTGTKEEFDQLTWAFGKEQQELLKTAQQQRADKLETESKNIVGAINELYKELQTKPDKQDVIDQEELDVFKDEIAAKYVTKDEFNTAKASLVKAITDLTNKVHIESDWAVF